MLVFSRVPCPKLLVLVDSDVVLLLRLMEEREGRTKMVEVAGVIHQSSR